MNLFICFLIVFSILNSNLLAEESKATQDPNIEKYHELAKAIDYPGRQAKQAQLGRIWRQALRLEKQGRFDEALKKYKEPLDSGMTDIDFDKAHFVVGIVETCQMKGEYEEALKELAWLLQLAPGKDEYQRKKQELDILILARNTNSPQPLYDHIKIVSKKYWRSIPPSRVDTYGEGLFGNFAYLYDIIGDFDAGIALCDNFAKHATQKPRIQNQYLAIRRAFEKDKKEGRESYITKPGKLGRATKALMQSDYFT